MPLPVEAPPALPAAITKLPELELGEEPVERVREPEAPAFEEEGVTSPVVKRALPLPSLVAESEEEEGEKEEVLRVRVPPLPPVTTVTLPLPPPPRPEVRVVEPPCPLPMGEAFPEDMVKSPPSPAPVEDPAVRLALAPP